jgi:hypothetical protein
MIKGLLDAKVNNLNEVYEKIESTLQIAAQHNSNVAKLLSHHHSIPIKSPTPNSSPVLAGKDKAKSDGSHFGYVGKKHDAKKECKKTYFSTHDGLAAIKTWANKFKFATIGKVVGDMAKIVKDTLSPLARARTNNTMSTFYIIKHDHYFRVFVSFSGQGDEKEERDNQKKFSAANVKNAFFVPYRNPKIKRKLTGGRDNISLKKDLFLRLLELSLKDKISPNFIRDYKLTDADLINIAKIKKLHDSEVCGKQYLKFKQEFENVSKAEFLFRILFGTNETFARLFEIPGYVTELGDIVHHRYLTAIPGASAYKTAMTNLWTSINNKFTAFELSVAQAHCAETNMLEFLYRNPGLVDMEGTHYIFSVKVCDRDAGIISEPCPGCYISFPERFQRLIDTLGISQKKFNPGDDDDFLEDEDNSKDKMQEEASGSDDSDDEASVAAPAAVMPAALNAPVMIGDFSTPANMAINGGAAAGVAALTSRGAISSSSLAIQNNQELSVEARFDRAFRNVTVDDLNKTLVKLNTRLTSNDSRVNSKDHNREVAFKKGLEALIKRRTIPTTPATTTTVASQTSVRPPAPQ